MKENKIIKGDGLEEMKLIPSKSVKLILADLPFETTQNKWDIIIPMNWNVNGLELNEFLIEKFKHGISYKDSILDFEKRKTEGLWQHYKRIRTDNGVIVLNSQFLFTSKLIASNEEEFKYSWVWKKGNKPTGFLNAKRQPLRICEDVLVFYKKQPTYNPQMVLGAKCHSRGKSIGTNKNESSNYGDYKDVNTLGNLKYPQNILDIPRDKIKLSPTQKPVELVEYFIKTYTNEGDTVLDNVSGSGTTAIGCINTNRRYIIIEKDPIEFKKGKDRIEKHLREK